MTAKSVEAQKQRIAIWVMAPETVPQSIIEPILWGLEEEGIPAEVQQTQNAPAHHLAKLAADGSPLNVGIGINVLDHVVALHHRDLPVGSPLFSLVGEDLNPACLRRLGANAARLFKGDPFILYEDLRPGREPPGVDDFPQCALEGIVSSVLEEILRAQDKR